MSRVTLNDKAARRPAPEAGQIELWDKLLPGFGLRIAAGGARTYFVMKRLDGKLVRRTVGKHPALHVTRDDPLAAGEYWPELARTRAQRMLADLARGVDPAVPLRPTKTPTTFGEVAEAYFKDPSKRGGGSLRSRSELERKVRVDLATWKDRPIAELARADVRAAINAKHATSPVSANRLLALVRRIFRWAVREELISANPAMDIDPPAQEEERDRVLSPSELARVWGGAEEMGYPYGPIVHLLILTAQRRSEVAGLERREVEGNAWRLPDVRAKRGKGHLIPLSPRAVAILQVLPKVGDGPLLFTTGKRAAKKGEKVDPKAAPAPVSGWSRMKDRLDWIIARKAARAADESGLGEDDGAAVAPERKRELLAKYGLAEWTLHDLRRSVATHLRDGDVMGESRADRLTVSKILNHAEGGMTRLYDRYSSDPEKRAALEAWSGVVDRFCGLNAVGLDGRRAC
jgi:integrase